MWSQIQTSKADTRYTRVYDVNRFRNPGNEEHAKYAKHAVLTVDSQLMQQVLSTNINRMKPVSVYVAHVLGMYSRMSTM